MERIFGAPDDIPVERLHRACRKAKGKGRPARIVRRYRRPGWTGDLPLYALWCGRCGAFTVSHPAGVGRISCHTPRCTTREPIWTRMRIRDKVLVPFWEACPRVLIAPLLILLVVLKIIAALQH